MPINPFDFIGPGTLKGALKGLDALGVPCKDGVEMLEELTSSHAYTKYRIDNATDKIQDFWDDHKENVSDFLTMLVKPSVTVGIVSQKLSQITPMTSLTEFVKL